MNRLGGRHLTTWSLVALLLGLGLGILLHGSSSPLVENAAAVLRTVGRVWITAIQYTVVPLVLSQALLAVLSSEKLGALGGKTLLLFAAMLVGAAAFTLLVGPLLVSLYRPDPATIAALKAGVAVPESLRAALGEGTSAGDFVRGWLPSSVGRLLRGANLLPVLVGAVLLGLVGRRLRGTARERFQNGARRLAELALRVVGVVLIFAPLGVLALSFGFARGAGGSAVGFLGVFVVMISSMLLLATLLLYPLTVLLGRVPLGRFAKAAAEPQLVAIGTRSSLATLPAMVESGRATLALPPAGTGFVLPLAVATFKLNMGVSHPFMLLFLASAFAVALSPVAIVTFVASILLFSFATPGIPGGNPGVATLPIFLSAGIPIEGVLILDAVDAIPDIFKTVINVTGDLSAATILTARPP